ncbi:MAG: PIN domain nuclease [Chloroflexi bacterium]|nr:PIN domain nuclease [Chloroflexota bacterium]
MTLETALRFIGGVLGGLAAWEVGLSLLSAQPSVEPASLLVALFVIVGASFGILFMVTPYLTTRPFFYVLEHLTHAPAGDVVGGVAGLVAGLLIAALLAAPLSALPWVFGWTLPLIASLTFGYLGALVGVNQRREILAHFGLPWGPGHGDGGSTAASRRVLLDTSAIIDGRVADVARTGFLPGPLIVPRFVLAELQRVADSPDPIRRQRGRRGLEMLARLQKDASVPVELIEGDVDLDGPLDVDAQLLVLAQSLRCPILTNDYNLNRVAGIQGIAVLNVNELANAVKTVVLPGELLTVKVIQEGKEFGQGVGYLDDGTMVVIENGRPLLNSQADVVVNRVIQTVAGRMVFAQPRQGLTAAPAATRG